MSKDGQDDKNVNNEKTQLNDNNSNNKQDQKENTSINHDTLTPEAVTSPSNANIADEQNTSQINSEFNQAPKAEGITNDPVGVEQNETNNKKEQSSPGTNIGDTQKKEESVDANREDTSTEEDEQAVKVSVEAKENAVQAGNTPNEAKEQVIANNVPTEPDKQDADSVDKDLKQLLSRIDKGESSQKLEDAQVKNVLGAIKAQLTATANPAELARLASAAASLASSTNNPEMLEQIKGIQAAIAKKEETAEQIVNSDIAAENLEVQEHQDPEMVRKHLEHEERKTRIDNNWAEYEKIEKESRERLIANNRFLDQIYNDPNSLTEEQKRLARGQYRSTEEKEEVERKAQQDIDFAKRTHELHRDLKHAIEHEQEQLNILAPKIEIEQTRAGNDELLQKKQQYEANISLYKERLEQHINPAIAELDLEREKLLKVVDTHPDLVKDRIRIHFEGNRDRYEEMKNLKGEPKALEEMEQLMKKAGLENKLNTKKRDKVDVPQSKETTSSQVVLSDISTNNKRHNILEETLNIVSENKLGGVAKEVISNIQIKGIENVGWLGDAQKMTGRSVTGPTSSVGNVTIKPPAQTPSVQKFAARGANIIKK
ncbi:hypothetical protein PQ676_07350 [Rickettsia felis]|uniref:Uncharacterized protein n=1 Tax=Rickettsia felis (strain ATCC VR-1525 / URRWXCal2) TaxID=315456 RepID=Q4UJH9_RICFE|nr:unknown [Rickettsia felis URRWXCal2]MDE8612005.1 hypothetical protein [Rickettsia felis]